VLRAGCNGTFLRVPSHNPLFSTTITFKAGGKWPFQIGFCRILQSVRRGVTLRIILDIQNVRRRSQLLLLGLFCQISRFRTATKKRTPLRVVCKCFKIPIQRYKSKEQILISSALLSLHTQDRKTPASTMFSSILRSSLVALVASSIAVTATQEVTLKVSGTLCRRLSKFLSKLPSS